MKTATDPVVNTASRDAILDAAESLMVQTGYEKTSISQICKKSGFPVGSVYHHFGSKAGVLTAIIERGSEQFFATMPQFTADGIISYEQQVQDYWLSAADTIYLNFNFFTLESDLLRADTEDAQILRIVTRVRKTMHERLEAVLTPYLCELSVSNPAELADRLVTFTVTFTRGALLEARGDLPRLRESMATLYSMLRGAMLEAAAR